MAGMEEGKKSPTGLKRMKQYGSRPASPTATSARSKNSWSFSSTSFNIRFYNRFVTALNRLSIDLRSQKCHSSSPRKTTFPVRHSLSLPTPTNLTRHRCASLSHLALRRQIPDHIRAALHNLSTPLPPRPQRNHLLPRHRKHPLPPRLRPNPTQDRPDAVRSALSSGHLRASPGMERRAPLRLYSVGVPVFADHEPGAAGDVWEECVVGGE